MTYFISLWVNAARINKIFILQERAAWAIHNWALQCLSKISSSALRFLILTPILQYIYENVIYLKKNCISS